MNEDPMKNLSLDALRKLLAAAEQAKATAVADIATISGEITKRTTAGAAALFSKAGKQNGDITFEADGVKLKASISKTVSWDSAKLQAVARELPWDRVQGLFDVKFAVPEAKYKVLGDVAPDLKAKIDEARTVKYGELTIKPVEGN